MKVLNDFKCHACGAMEELLVDNTQTTVVCQHCGMGATKVTSVPNLHLPGTDPVGLPTAADKWVKKREQKMAQERKAENT